MRTNKIQAIQDVAVFLAGGGYLGVTSNFTLPNIEQEMLESKGAIQAKHGTGIIKPLEVGFKLKVLNSELFEVFGQNTFRKHEALIFKGSVFTNGRSAPVEAEMKGDIISINVTEFEGGKAMEVDIKFSAQFYKLTVDGVNSVLIDRDNYICSFGGKDYLSDLRNNLSL